MGFVGEFLELGGLGVGKLRRGFGGIRQGGLVGFDGTCGLGVAGLEGIGLGLDVMGLGLEFKGGGGGVGLGVGGQSPEDDGSEEDDGAGFFNKDASAVDHGEGGGFEAGGFVAGELQDQEGGVAGEGGFL